MSDFSNTEPGGDAAERYKRAVFSALGDADPMDVLAATPARLAELVLGLDDEAVRRPEAPGKWSIVEVATHLADSELAWAWRLRTVVADERPVLTGYDQNAWCRVFRYRDADPARAVASFRTRRTENLELLGALEPAQLERTGRHSERGVESVADMIRLYAGHDLVHLAQIERQHPAR